jgi:hypothetical protein
MVLVVLLFDFKNKLGLKNEIEQYIKNVLMINRLPYEKIIIFEVLLWWMN